MKRVFVFAVLLLLFSFPVKAQQAVRHPGDVIRISVTFAGSDAEKISQVFVTLDTPETIPSQPAFPTNITTGQYPPTGSNTFEVSFTIPENQASGEYKLTSIRAIINLGTSTIQLNYSSPADFKAKTFKIENPKSLVKPMIKDVKVP